MSLWDILIILMICLAIFRGYFKGLCRRLSDWVGMVIALCVSCFSTGALNRFITSAFGVNGQERVTEWLESYFASRVAANPDNQLESLKQWVAGLFLPDGIKESLYSTIEDSADEVYVSIYDQVARVMSEPLWHFILILLGTLLCFALLVLIGEVCGLAVRRFRVTMVIDRFLGAIASGFLIMVVVGIFTAVAVFIVPESAGWLGRSLHGSFMGPILNQAVDGLIRGGGLF